MRDNGAWVFAAPKSVADSLRDREEVRCFAPVGQDAFGETMYEPGVLVDVGNRKCASKLWDCEIGKMYIAPNNAVRVLCPIELVQVD